MDFQQRTGTREPRGRADAQAVDHAASYLRQRLNLGQYAGMDGVYAGYALCGLLDVLALDLRAGRLSPRVRAALVCLTHDLAHEEQALHASQLPRV